jgi:hypothetical protein
LHTSTGGTHTPHAHVAEHMRVPVEPHVVGHIPVEPAAHAKPLSTTPSQSSSRPLHTSIGGMHVPQAHADEHIRVPVEPHVVGHIPVEPIAHAKPLSTTPSQSSSRPLHTSIGGMHAPHAHIVEHVRVPVVPQEVGHIPIDPDAHGKPLSTTPSQSSSRPLHTSAGGVHVADPPAHAVVPIEPHVVVHMMPAVQHPSSMRPSQLSSMPLPQISAGGVHLTTPDVHALVPIVPHVVVQGMPATGAC